MTERSAKSYELEIARLEKALSDECANSYRLSQELKDAQLELAEAKLRAHHQIVKSDPVTFSYRTDTPPSGPAPPDPQLTRVQAGLVVLLHEIGGVEKQETVRLRATVLGDLWAVRLIVVGDGARPVEVLVDGDGQAVWRIVGERL